MLLFSGLENLRVFVSEWAFYIVAASWGYSLDAVQGLLTEVASLAAGHGL